MCWLYHSQRAESGKVRDWKKCHLKWEKEKIGIEGRRLSFILILSLSWVHASRISHPMKYPTTTQRFLTFIWSVLKKSCEGISLKLTLHPLIKSSSRVESVYPFARLEQLTSSVSDFQPNYPNTRHSCCKRVFGSTGINWIEKRYLE